MDSAAENVRQMNNEITVDNETIVDIVVPSDRAWQNVDMIHLKALSL